MSAPPNILEEIFTVSSLNKLKYLINLSVQSESLIIKGNTIEQIPPINYKNNYTYNDIIKSNKYFKMCDTISEVLLELKNIVKNNIQNIKITEDTNKLIISFPLPSYLSTEISFHIEKTIKNEKEEISDLYKSIQILSEKIKKFEDNINQNDIILNLEKKVSDLEKENNLLKNQIKKINEYLFPISIFNSKITFDEKLIKDWIGKKFTAELLFSISKNGTEPSEFHRLCDNKGPTIIFIETAKGYIFGGYTELDWDTSSSYKTDNSTFLFSINNKAKYTRRNNKCSIYCRNDLAPSFGGDSNPDIFCMGSCKKGKICESNTFATSKELNNGESSFDVKEMEVYKIKLI